MANLKILQVTAGLEEGGVERGTVEMAAYISSMGAESFVASSGGRLVPLLETCKARHFYLPLNRRNPFDILRSAIGLVMIIRKNDINLVHARSRAPAWAALLACKFTKTSFVTTFHGTHKIQNSLKKLYNSSMVRGERVIAISQFIKQHIMANYRINEERIDLAPRGFSKAVFDPEKISINEITDLRSSLGLKPDTFVICLPGRLTRWKGQVDFVNSLSALKDLPDWVALLVGGEGKRVGYKAELQRLCSTLGLTDRVLMVGSQANMPLYYAISDVVVSASLEPEAFGRVAVEAQAMRKPVIATAHGGSLETVIDGETGWLVSPGKPRELSDLLRRIILGEYDLVEIGNNAMKWVSSNFTTETTCKAEWDSYKKIDLRKIR